MPILKLKNHDEAAEIIFEIEHLKKLSQDDRFRMMIEKSKIARELMKRHGHSQPPQILKRK